MSPTTRTVVHLIAVTALARLALAGPGTSFALAPESITVLRGKVVKVNNDMQSEGDPARAVQ